MVELLKSDYGTLANFDSANHVKNVTYDYVLVEEGEVWDLNRELQHFRENAKKKRTRTNDFKIHLVKFSGATGYAVYDLKSLITTEGKPRGYHWLETAIFRKISNQWKITLIHSTEIPPSQ